MQRIALFGAAASTLAVGLALADTPIVLTLVSWGGGYQASQQKAYSEPYRELHPNVSFLWDESSAAAVSKLRAMAEVGKTTWDLVDVVASDAIRLCDEGLVMEIDHDRMLAAAPDGTPASEDFGDLLVSECFIPQVVYSTAFGYRTDVDSWNGMIPDDVCDFFDLAAFPGKRSLEKQPFNNLEWALLCSGVPKSALYETLNTMEGQDRAFTKLDEIKSQIVWWTAGAESPQLLADAEVVFASGYNGRLFSLIEEQNQPVAMLWDAQVFDLDGWVIPTDLTQARRKAALDFVRFATDTRRLADQARYIPYGPARASSVPLIGKHTALGIDMRRYMPTNPENARNALIYNYEWWADYRDDLDARFQAWLAQ